MQRSAFLLPLLGLVTADLSILLTPEDNSYSIHGYDLSRIKVLTVANSNSNGYIYMTAVTSNFTNPEICDYTITDSAGSYNCTNLAKSLKSPFTVRLGSNNGIGQSFGMSFSRSDSTNALNQEYQNGLVLVQPQNQATVSMSPVRETYITFVNAKTKDDANMECSPDSITTPNCTVSLYLEGVPGNENGKKKYKLFDFNTTTLERYTPSYVIGRSATFFVPLGCIASLQCTGSDIMSAQKIQEATMGFAMAAGYPGAFPALPTHLFSQLAYKYSWTNNININIDLVRADPEPAGNFSITIGAQFINITSATSDEQYSMMGREIQWNWQPYNESAKGFLFRFATTGTRPVDPVTSDNSTSSSNTFGTTQSSIVLTTSTAAGQLCIAASLLTLLLLRQAL